MVLFTISFNAYSIGVHFLGRVPGITIVIVKARWFGEVDLKHHLLTSSFHREKILFVLVTEDFNLSLSY